MDEPRYKILFDGLTVMEMSEETVKANLARLFKCEPARVAPLFRGKTIAMKRGLSESGANQYVESLRKAGALARKERETPPDEKKLVLRPAPITSALVEAPVFTPPSPAFVQPEAQSATTQNANHFWDNAPIRPQQTDDLPQTGDVPPEEKFAVSTPQTPEYCDLHIFSVSLDWGALGSGRYGGLFRPNFEGRLGRLRFIGWSAMASLVAFGSRILFGGVYANIISLYVGAILMSFFVRRLHDINLSGWWVPLFVGIPIALIAAGMIRDSMALFTLGLLVYFLVMKPFLFLKAGSTEENDFGLPPPPNSNHAPILAGIGILLFVISFGLTLHHRHRIMHQTEVAKNQKPTPEQLEHDKRKERTGEFLKRMKEQSQQNR
jgi:uncharacterized membrane protein YhaH (DUF805 family)